MNTPNQAGSNPSSSTSGGASQGADSPGTGARNELQDKASELAKEAKARGQAELDQYRQSALSQVETLAESARAAATTLQTNDSLGLSRYVAEVADGMQLFAGKLRGKSLDELLHDAGELARNNPALFLAGSLAVGFGLTRFIKATRSGEPAADSGLRAETANEPDWHADANPSGDSLASASTPVAGASPHNAL
ncbi:MAG TPA: hypothetical protein VJA19_11395 [Pseudomonas sp.]|nr:hypothetical protein [Pseudomonas sp.]